MPRWKQLVLASGCALTVAAGAAELQSGQPALPAATDEADVAIALIDVRDYEAIAKLVEQFHGKGWTHAHQVADGAPIIFLDGLDLESAELLLTRLDLLPATFVITDADAAVSSGAVHDLPADDPTASGGGWSATTSESDKAFVDAAIELCLEANDLFPDLLRDAPVVHDQRGPNGAAILFVGQESMADCLMYRLADGEYAAWQANWGGLYAANDGVDQVSLDLVTQSAEAPSVAFGPAPTGVSSVRIVTESGRVIDATVANGWFLAWWPGIDPLTAITLYGQDGIPVQELQAPHGR